MRWVLPGGAMLGGGEGRRVVCRSNTAVIERTKPRRSADPPRTEPVQQQSKVVPPQPEAAPPVSLVPPPELPVSKFKERVTNVKLLLEVLAVLVGLIGAVLALLGWSRK